MALREYQRQLVTDVRYSWANGAPNVLMRLDTGGGKSVCLADLYQEEQQPSALIAHRAELVSQLSMTLGKAGVYHDLVASDADKKIIARLHQETFGRRLFQPGCPRKIISVDTFVKRAEALAPWSRSVVLWGVDEGHHVLRDNKWGHAVSQFTHPYARGVLPTATPARADGQGLGRHADGVADIMVQGPPAKWLMEQGFLCRYRVAAWRSHITKYLGEVGKSGDWSTAQLKQASKLSEIVGDVVQSYQQFGNGKLGITFATDVETANNMAAAYNAAGIPASVLTGEHDAYQRRIILDRFERREYLQIVAVDVVSEGFDLPAVDVVTMARPTDSLPIFLQQLGRGLRPAKGKQYLQLIDHCGNYLRHRGGPDAPRNWTLDRRKKKQQKDPEEIPLVMCFNPECALAFEGYLDKCPFCGVAREVGKRERGSPEQVAGVLEQLDDSILAMLRGEIAVQDMSANEYRQHIIGKGLFTGSYIEANVNRHLEKQGAQADLRGLMDIWGGIQKARGLSDREMQSLFYYRFGCDVLTAQTLPRAETVSLIGRLANHLS